jgi:Mce-associated membrane protein
VRRVRPVVALYVTTVLLACGAVLLGYLAWVERGERAETRERAERYGAVLASARGEATAFINIDYREAQESIDAVAAGATGEFEEQYTESVDSVIEVLEQNESVMTGEVVWAGVVSLDSDSARVIAATSGTVANVSTQGEPVDRAFRLLLDLTYVEGRWLTNNLEFVG